MLIEKMYVRCPADKESMTDPRVFVCGQITKVDSFKKTVHARAISINVENPNDGDAFESLLFEKYGQPWKYSGNKPFWEGPDIEIDGVGYQIKYIGGTYINEHTLERLNNR